MWVQRATVVRAIALLGAGSIAVGMGIAFVSALQHGIATFAPVDVAILLLMLAAVGVSWTVRVVVIYDSSRHVFWIRRYLVLSHTTCVEEHEAKLIIHPVQLRFFRTSRCWSGHALIMWLPRGKWFVFSCVRSREQLAESVEQFPPPMRESIERNSPAAALVRARYSMIT